MVWARMTGPALRVTAIMPGVTELRSREGRGRPVSLEQNMILKIGYTWIISNLQQNHEMMFSPI